MRCSSLVVALGRSLVAQLVRPAGGSMSKNCAAYLGGLIRVAYPAVAEGLLGLVAVCAVAGDSIVYATCVGSAPPPPS